MPRRQNRVKVLDPFGRPIKSDSVPGFEASGRGFRGLRWQASNLGINALHEVEGRTLRNKARDAERKNAYALTARRMTVANLVGTGIVPVVSPKLSESVREALTEAWEDFNEQCDADGQSDFYGMQAAMVSGTFTEGEALLRFRPRRLEDGLAVPLQLQSLSAEMIDSAKNESMTSRFIRDGIEFDGIGRRRAYWLYRTHPDEVTTSSADGGTSIPIPAEQICHMYDQYSPGQCRGFPWASVALSRLYELDQYDDAEVVRKKIAALFAAFITTPDDDPIGAGSEGYDEDDGLPLAGLEAGTIQFLEPGQEISFSEPSDVGRAYIDFMKVQLRAIASGLGLTYHQLTGDLSDVNFTSIRAVLIEQRRLHDQIRRNMIVFKVCRRVWRRFVEAAVLVGRVSIPKTELATAMRPGWVLTPGYEWVDPEKQVKADVLALENGLTSRTKLIWERGYDPKSLDEEIKRDKEREESLGLKFGAEAEAEFAAANEPTPEPGSGNNDDEEREAS